MFCLLYLPLCRNRLVIEIPLIHMLFTIVNHWKRIWTMTLPYRHGRNPSMTCILKEKCVGPWTVCAYQAGRTFKRLLYRIFDDINCSWWYILIFVSTDIWQSNSTFIYIMCFTQPVVSINSDHLPQAGWFTSWSAKAAVFWVKLLAICGFRRILGYPPPNAYSFLGKKGLNKIDD